MTESLFPFGSADAASPDEQESADGRRNATALTALAVVAVGAGAFFFLGGSDEVPLDVTVGAGVVTPAAAAPVPSAQPVTKLPVASAIKLGRSPFDVLYTAPKEEPVVAEVTEGAPTGPSTPTDTATPGGSVPVVVVTNPGGGGAEGGSAGGDERPVLHELVLTRVYGEGKDRIAVFTVDGKQQTAKVGGTFGPTAELLLLSLQQGPADDQWTAVLQVGDSDPFDVITGQKSHVP